MNVGDIVYLPCRVVGTGNMAFSQESVLDLVPVGFKTEAERTIDTVRVFKPCVR